MSDFVAAARRAALAFGLEPDRVEILSHSENVVCDLTLPDGSRLVMRLHRPRYNTLRELESEVQWVGALDAAGIPVPRNVSTTSGDFFTEVEVAGEAVHVGVVEWVHGSPLGEQLQAGSGEIVAHYQRIGQLAARIRNHHGDWAIPENFTRRRWDVDGLVGDASLWGRFWEVESLTRAQRDLFTRTRTLLAERLSSLPITNDYFGLIHADLHLSNVMADGDQLTIIDFDDCGFGWFAHELAVVLQPVFDTPWSPDAYSALLDGYRTEHRLGAEEESWINSFLTARCLMIVGWLDARRELARYRDFDKIVTRAETACTHYLQGSDLL